MLWAVMNEIVLIFRKSLLYTQMNTLSNLITRIIIAAVMSLVTGAIFWDLPTSDAKVRKIYFRRITRSSREYISICSFFNFCSVYLQINNNNIILRVCSSLRDCLVCKPPKYGVDAVTAQQFSLM